MCYHKSVPDKTEIENLLGPEVQTELWDKSYHHITGFSHAGLPVLTAENPNKLEVYNWGLIPFWVKDRNQADEMKARTLNAKSETIFELPSFRASIVKKRCLLFTDGFYEWREVNKTNYPYYIYLKNQKTFAFGGIYQSWIDKETGEIHYTCSVVTTPANPLMAKIHNKKERMPLIFTKETMHDWLNPQLKKEDINNLMKPLDDSLMDAHTISKLITSRKENSNVPAVKEKFVYPELAG